MLKRAEESGSCEAAEASCSAYKLQAAGSGVKVRSQQGLVGKQHT